MLIHRNPDESFREITEVDKLMKGLATHPFLRNVLYVLNLFKDQFCCGLHDVRMHNCSRDFRFVITSYACSSGYVVSNGNRDVGTYICFNPWKW